ncbi:MAG: flagellar protein FlgN [Desulfobacterales bacterium]|nr:flagellar protein FlgN [Desulfobacterales bacterium]
MILLADKINALLQRKIVFYKELADCLEKEKICLSSNDINPLWKISEEKHFFVSQIESLRLQILSSMTGEGIEHNTTVASFSASKVISLIEWEDPSQVENIVFTINSLKLEIQHKVRENIAFVEECLSVIEEIMSIITRAKRSGIVYGSDLYPKENANLNLVFHEEV